MFLPSRTVKIFPPGQNPSFPTAWPAWVGQSEEALLLRRLRPPCPKETEPKSKELKIRRRGEKVKEKEEEEEEEEEETKEEEEKKEKRQQEEEMEKEELEEEEGEEEEEEEEENGWWLLGEAEDQDGKKRLSSSSFVQAATSMSLVAKSTVVSIKLPFGSREGNQYPQDLANSVEVTTLISSREFSCGLSAPSSHSPVGVVSTQGWSGEDILRCLTPASASCSSLWETFPKKELQVNCLPGSTDSQEPKEVQSEKPQAIAPGSPATLVPALKRPCKRKAATLELQLPPSGLLLLWDQGDLPPPPKIPRITGKASDTMKTLKGEVTQISDDEVDALQPKTQVVAAGPASQPILPSPPPASRPAGFVSLPTDGVSSPGPPASTLLLFQAAGPPGPSVPSPSLIPAIPTTPISPSPLPSDPLPPCRARPSVESPPDAKKDPAGLATALASAISHLPRPGPGPLPFSAPSCRRGSPASVCMAGPPPFPFPAASLTLSPRNPPVVISTTAPHACEDMSWEPSSGPSTMDMDTTPPSEAAILSSPPVSSGGSLPFAPSHACMQQRLAANANASIGPPAFRVPCYTPIGNSLYTLRPTNGQKQGMSPAGDPGVWIQPGLVPALPLTVSVTPSHPAMDLEFMDTTPPSEAVILHSPPVTDHFSNSSRPWSVWGPATACNQTGATPQPTPALLSGPQPGGCVFMRNPPTSLASQWANGSTTQPLFAVPASPANHGRPAGFKLAYEKRPCASYIARPTSGFTLSTGMGSGDCSSSSTIFTPGAPASVRPAVPLSGGSCWQGRPKPGLTSAPRHYIGRRKGKDGRATVAPVVLRLHHSPAHSGGAVQAGAGGR